MSWWKTGSEQQELSSQNLRKCPIVYRPEYNTNLCGLPHPFDGYKWGKVYQQLCDRFPTLVDSSHKPEEVTQDQLLLAHSRAYLSSLKDPRKAAKALELPIAQLTPQLAATMESDVLLPMRFQAGGTVLAAELAVNNRSWAINIGGGFHHASGKKGGSGFCVYADITVALQNLFRQGKIRHAMIVDLDAHQGNGHEHDFKGDNRVYVFDMFNDKIFPHDEEAFETIRYRWHVRLDNGTGDNVYLNKLRSGLNAALADSPKCDLIIYNAGTDLLAGDHLGRLNVSYEAVINRDEFVFQTARERQIPIVMVTSGGYTAQSGKLIAESILNLHNKGLIQLF